MAYNSIEYIQQPLTDAAPVTYTINPNSLQYGRHKVSVRIIDGIGDPVTSGITGTIAIAVRGIGSDGFEPGAATLDISGTDRSFVPILDNINAIRLTASNMVAGHSAIVTIASSGSDI
jgi:hypothetical protein